MEGADGGYGGCEWKELTRSEWRVVEGINGGCEQRMPMV